MWTPVTVLPVPKNGQKYRGELFQQKMPLLFVIKDNLVLLSEYRVLIGYPKKFLMLTFRA